MVLRTFPPEGLSRKGYVFTKCLTGKQSEASVSKNPIPWIPPKEIGTAPNPQ